MQFTDQLLNSLSKDPFNWESLFDNPLSMSDEIMLNEIMLEIHHKVHSTLNHAMEEGPVVYLTAGRKNWVMDLLAVQKRIRVLLDTRGSVCLDAYTEN